MRAAGRGAGGQTTQARVIVCEADPLDAAIVLSVLSQAGHDGIAVSSAEALRDEIARQETRGVVLSENLPGVDGRRLCSDLRADDFRGVIVLLTGSASVDREVTALEGGADAAVAKPIEPRLLLAHLDAAGRRRTESESLSWDLVRVADAELSLRQQRLAIGDRRPVYVTTTEARLLEYLMRNSPLTVTRDALVEQTWPHDELVDANRVDVSMARLRKKVEPEPAHPAYIHTTRGIGYYFCPPSRVWNGERRDGG